MSQEALASAGHLESSWPGLFRPSTSLSQRVDTRNKPGHDEWKDQALSQALNRQPVLLGQFLQRNLRPGADVLDHFGGGERAEAAGIFMAGVTHQAEQETGGEQIAGACRVDEFLDRKCR